MLYGSNPKQYLVKPLLHVTQTMEYKFLNNEVIVFFLSRIIFGHSRKMNGLYNLYSHTNIFIYMIQLQNIVIFTYVYPAPPPTNQMVNLR